MFKIFKKTFNFFSNHKKEVNEEKNSVFDHPILNAILAQTEKNSSENTIFFIRKILNSIEKGDFKKIKDLCINGIPDEVPLLRSLIWKLNLGYLKGNYNEWDENIMNKREEYNYLKEAFSLKINLEKKIFEENLKRESIRKSKTNINEKLILNIKLRSNKKQKYNSTKNLYKIIIYEEFKNENENVKIKNKRLRSYEKKLIKNLNLTDFSKSNINFDDANKNSSFNNNLLYSNIEKILNNINVNNTSKINDEKCKKIINNNSIRNFTSSNNYTSILEDDCIESNKEKTKLEAEFKTIVNNKDRELIEDIYKDMRRTHSDFQFFLRPSNKKTNQINDKDVENIIKRRSFNVSAVSFHTVIKEMDMEETHMDVIARILYIYSKTQSGLNYVQGMNELCSMIYYIIFQEEELNSFNNQKFIFSKNKELNKMINKDNDLKLLQEKIQTEVSFNRANLNIDKMDCSSLNEFSDFENFLSYSEILSIKLSKNANLVNNNQINDYQIKQTFSDSKQNNIDLKSHHLKSNQNENSHNIYEINNNNQIKSNLTTKIDETQNPINENKKISCESEKGNDIKELMNTNFEADTYWCFYNLMEKLKYIYMRTEDDKELGIFKKIENLKLALKLYDPNLNSILQDKNIDPGIFTLRWFILLFCQDFTLPDVIRIWDIILSIEDGTDIFFKVYIFSLAIMTIKKNSIQQSDYVTFIMEMQNLYDINIEILIETYFNILKSFSKKLKKILKC